MVLDLAGFLEDLTGRKQGFGSGLSSRFVPVLPRTGTHGGHTAQFVRPGAGRASWSIGPGSSGGICPGSRQEPGPMGLAPGPQPLVPVCGSTRDESLAISTGSSHKPGLVVVG